ncbi:hypothetical protein BBJ28_00001497 [Nothophytophthora sp. Chile5]|nr:hypothetical protein BBJ28_00001497 [Nothophytophthora sp. Chile5]
MHMQVIHELVTVSVTQCELRAHSQQGSDSDGGADATTTTLRYVAVNAGLSTVTFCTDFSESANIHLRFPSDKRHHHLNSTEKAALEKTKTSQPLAFVCTLHPFERRILVYVLKRGKQRALVRVAYAVLSIATPSSDTIVEAQTRAATVIQQQQQSSSHTYSYLSKREILLHLSATEVNRACEEINRHFREYGTVFVDASFPPSTTSLYEPEALEKLSESDASAYSLCRWEHLRNAVDSSWTFVTAPSKRPKQSPLSESAMFASFTSGLPCQDSFLCAMALIAPLRDLWLWRWFPSLEVSSPPEESVATAIKLCDRESDIVDATALSPATVDTNLQLVFDCLDREGRHELTKDDLASFLNLFEHVTPASQLGSQTLHDFLRRFGSSARPDSDERSLTLDDLRDVYLNLAAHDGSACRAVTDTEKSANRSWTQHGRFKELVWHDLLRLLHDDDDKEGGERYLVDDTEPTTQVDRRELVELVCCIHSDTPLLNVAALPGGKGSLVANAT